MGRHTESESLSFYERGISIRLIPRTMGDGEIIRDIEGLGEVLLGLASELSRRHDRAFAEAYVPDVPRNEWKEEIDAQPQGSGNSKE